MIPFILCLGLSPRHLPQHHRATTHAIRRSRPLSAPMAELTSADVPFLDVSMPHRLVADSAIRSVMYMFRLGAGMGADAALGAAGGVRDMRILTTSSTMGAVSSAQGLATAVARRDTLASVQHASMLIHHPVELCRWASRVLPSRLGGASVSPPFALSAMGAARLASSLWLLWIVATTLVSLRQLRSTSTSTAGRRTLRLRLSKLALDSPLALHFLFGGHALPLAAVGLLGTVSSILGLRAALGDPSAERPRLRLPMPLLALGPSALAAERLWRYDAADADAHCVPRRRRLSGTCVGGCGSPRRWKRTRISDGPLARSCEW